MEKSKQIFGQPISTQKSLESSVGLRDILSSLLRHLPNAPSPSSLGAFSCLPHISTWVSNHHRKLPISLPAPHVWSSSSPVMATSSFSCSGYMQPWCRSTFDSSHSPITSRWSVTYTRIINSSHSPPRLPWCQHCISCLHYYESSLSFLPLPFPLYNLFSRQPG